MTFVIALIAAFVVNLDTIRVGTFLWEQPALAEKLKLASIEEPRPTDTERAIKTGEQLFAAMNASRKRASRLDGRPVIFSTSKTNHGQWQAFWVASPSVWYRPLLGWFITAVAALFGAPFWFDMLQSIIRLKGAGPSPDEKANRAASS